MAAGILTDAQILTPSRTEVFLAAVGTAAPTTIDTIPEAWLNVGFTTEDSLSFETTPEFEEFRSAQSDFPVKKFQTSIAASVQVDLAQWNTTNFQTVYGGGSVEAVAGSTGLYKYTPPRLGDMTSQAALVRVTEGSKKYIYVFPQVQQTEGVSVSLNKGAASTLPLRLDVLGADGVDPWYLITNDTAFAPA